MGLESDHELRIALHGSLLLGDWALPPGATGLVLFVNGRGGGRHGAHDRAVARATRAHGFGTVLVDMLTVTEQQARPHPGLHGVDLALLTQRVLDVTAWIEQQSDLRDLELGLCGVCGGGPAALIAGARLGTRLRALVSIGGRADLAGPAALAGIRASTLLLAGSRDTEALKSNDAAFQHLRCERSAAVVPGAGVTLDEPGVLLHAAEMAADWYSAHFAVQEETA